VLVTRVEIDGRAVRDVRCENGVISAIDHDLPRVGDEPMIDAAGGAVVPGLHDHHIHLLALAAADASVACGPPTVRTIAELGDALGGRGNDRAWIRGVGYHESVAGDLDRDVLDRLVPDRPLRVQHRSGAAWILNSAAVGVLGLDTGVDAAGVERDRDGRATGRLFRLDTWLREHIDATPPELASVGKRLAGYGVTGVTDATPDNSAATLAHIGRALETRHLHQRIVAMGPAGLPATIHPGIERGAVKLVLDERSLPEFDELVGRIAAAHDDERAVAIHCVTRAELVFAAAAIEHAAPRIGDRIEHASVTPPEILEQLARLPITVVTQPGFIRERGDAYRVDVDADELPWLYRCRGFLEARVALGGGTDAPFGDPDPWLAMQSAVSRRTGDGVVLGGDESLTPEQALALFTSAPGSPGGPSRRIEVGKTADLCVLDSPWSTAREELTSDRVLATVVGGEITWSKDDPAC